MFTSFGNVKSSATIIIAAVLSEIVMSFKGSLLNLSESRFPQPVMKPGARKNQSDTSITNTTETLFSSYVIGPSSFR